MKCSGTFREEVMGNLVVVAILSSVALAGTLSPSFAACVGSGLNQYCSDAEGNSYAVQRFGRQYYISGFNAKTGGRWTQTLTIAGDMVNLNGMTGGESWKIVGQRIGDTKVLAYTDHKGRTWTYTCTPSACKLTCNQPGCN
jgi:hypothetical protein